MANHQKAKTHAVLEAETDFGKCDLAYFLDDFQTDQKKDTSNWKKEIKKAAKERGANSDKHGAKPKLQQAIHSFETALASERQVIRDAAEKYRDELNKLRSSHRKDSGSSEQTQTATYKAKVPLHGALKSVGVQLEEHATALNYQSVFKHHTGEVSGLSGKILGFALSQRQKESILTENFLRFQD